MMLDGVRSKLKTGIAMTDKNFDPDRISRVFVYNSFNTITTL